MPIDTHSSQDPPLRTLAPPLALFYTSQLYMSRVPGPILPYHRSSAWQQCVR